MSARAPAFFAVEGLALDVAPSGMLPANSLSRARSSKVSLKEMGGVFFATKPPRKCPVRSHLQVFEW